MDTSVKPLETLIERVENYSKITIDLAKLTAIDKTSEVVSSLASRLVILVIIALFAFVINIGLSLWIGDVLGKLYYGFFVVSGIYLIIGIIVYAARENWIKNPVQNLLIAQMLKEKYYGK